MSDKIFDKIISIIRHVHNEPNDFIPLHVPRFIGNEKKYVLETISSTFVSSVGKFVNKLEEKIADYTGAKYAIATINGTSALHIALLLAGVKHGDEVICPSLTFIATANAISYCGAIPHFFDIDLNTMGLSASKVETFLEKNCTFKNKKLINNNNGNVISAILPMHTFGHPVDLDKFKSISQKWNLPLIEDSAESLGSLYKNKHTGTFGDFGIISFNGNKIITAGAGGIILTDNENLAIKAKHITSTAKISHTWKYEHDEIGFNYRMANINAALLYAQLEQLNTFVSNKRKLAQEYKNKFKEIHIPFISEPKNCKSNYWLNAILLDNANQRNNFIEYAYKKNIQVRPVWKPISELTIYSNAPCESLDVTIDIANRIVNVPSSVTLTT